jgi:hypothetical protein
MSKYFPDQKDRDAWSPISINANLPLLGMVSSTDHPGLYQCRYKYKQVNGKKVPLQVILKRFDQVNRYPHLTIDFDATTGVILKFHASDDEYDENNKRISYGSEELIKLIMILQPMFGSMSTNDALAILDSE